MSVEVKNLCFSYGEHEVLHDVSFSVEAGEFLSILGPNGVGKSTLFRCVLGLLRNYTGSVTVEGRDAKSLSIREAARLIAVTEQSFWEGMKFARFGYRVSDISHAVQQYAEAQGCSLVRDYVGHGVGAKLHEAPEVPNFGPAGHGPRLLPGMTLAVEPMVCAGDWQVKVLADKWTTVSLDGSLTAHYENSILITDGEPEILTVTGE